MFFLQVISEPLSTTLFKNFMGNKTGRLSTPNPAWIPKLHITLHKGVPVISMSNSRLDSNLKSCPYW